MYKPRQITNAMFTCDVGLFHLLECHPLQLSTKVSKIFGHQQHTNAKHFFKEQIASKIPIQLSVKLSMILSLS
jgi:hypothetical protein